MILRYRQLVGLPVRTKSGHKLGWISDLELDVEKSEISKYVISSSRLVKNILSQDLLIDKSQVIEISEKEMVVDDNLASQIEAVKELAST